MSFYEVNHWLVENCICFLDLRNFRICSSSALLIFIRPKIDLCLHMHHIWTAFVWNGKMPTKAINFSSVQDVWYSIFLTSVSARTENKTKPHRSLKWPNPLLFVSFSPIRSRANRDLIVLFYSRQILTKKLYFVFSFNTNDEVKCWISGVQCNCQTSEFETVKSHRQKEQKISWKLQK